MITTSQAFAFLSVLCSFVGTLLVFLNSPRELAGIDGGGADADYDAEQAKLDRQWRLRTAGNVLTLIGGLIALALLFA